MKNTQLHFNEQTGLFEPKFSTKRMSEVKRQLDERVVFERKNRIAQAIFNQLNKSAEFHG